MCSLVICKNKQIVEKPFTGFKVETQEANYRIFLIGESKGFKGLN